MLCKINLLYSFYLLVTTAFHLKDCGLKPTPEKYHALIFSLFNCSNFCFFPPRLFSPIVMVPLVCVVGLGLFMRGFPVVISLKEHSIALVALIIK